MTSDGSGATRRPDPAIRLRPAIRARGVKIEVHAPPGLEVLVDPGRIRQVLDNLLENALRHAPEDSTISVSGEHDGSTLRITVADRGPGFPPEFLPRAFDRFARADIARSRETGGTGLGLAIVASIAASLGGQARAANRLDGGAAVIVELPDAVVLSEPRSQRGEPEAGAPGGVTA